MRHKNFTAKMAVGNGDGRTFTATITAAVRDREDEVLIPDGMRTVDFDKNPAVFWSHDYTQPIGQAVKLERKGDAWEATTRMAERPEGHPAEAEWFPDTVHSLIQQGVVRGVSVGFKPLASRHPTQKDRAEFGTGVKRVHSKWDLLEFSVTPLPANQDALISAVSKGLVTAARCKSLFGVDVKTEPSRSAPAPRRIQIGVDVSGWPPPPKRKRVDPARKAGRDATRSVLRHMGRMYE